MKMILTAPSLVRAATIAVAAAGWLTILPAARAAEVAGNLSAVAAGTEPADASRWISAAFLTGTTTSTLHSVSLWLSANAGTNAEVLVYSGNGLEPGTLVATLTPPCSLPQTPGAATFTAPAGISLSANTTYWMLLRAPSGTVNWAWTNTNTGSGTGFKRDWTMSINAGVSWWTHDIYPLMMSVRVDEPVGNVCDCIDFNRDGVSPDSDDLTDFLSVFGGGPCSNDPPQGTGCGDIDFNNDGVSPDTADIEALLRVFGGGAC